MDQQHTETFRGVEAATGEPLELAFPAQSAADVAPVCKAAGAAFDAYRATSSEARAAFLEAIGDEIMALGDPLLKRAELESGLPAARLTGERGRTVGQLRLFADLVRSDRWRGVRIDPALPDREPLPRPDLRLRMIPLGPVAVFGASNFPLAFSTAGGDTASALAAGCPVVVKGHPAHPGTDSMVAGAIARAAEKTGMPTGVFGHVMGTGNELGAALVRDPNIAAVGFTGSRAGGLALAAIAQEREVPIPVYAEMSSVNPVVLLPGALSENAAALGAAFVGSLTMGAGQFCTNPGLVIAVDSPDLRAFEAAAAEVVAGAAGQVMLTSGIREAYQAGVARLEAAAPVELLATGGDSLACQATARLFAVTGRAVADVPELLDEVFGASSLIVRCEDADELQSVLAGLEGQLTATLHLSASDHAQAASLLPILERKCGRILVNGWPTGVEVAHAMVHGGPFPATIDGRTTSVGTLAIERFLRPVSYQNMPADLLPPELHDDAGVPRLVDGKLA
ncbi:aldehyde dehydrogenase (NADP(+)) [Aurantiacibacter luteus]|uniref:2,5-dioxovalerate dehydrogenase n=1 Tax=Aurantiacibacter luteus TaxID=1581420 RepID=A0A0G9MZ14_9SPHN|nr:aldehyde dehydrogenase (NADP(+)) [Aurantiacibacter luteus]KLE35945.1 2,5-dioxovalerate dehydrogenase [Aurantiacibacter luteus]